MRTFKTLKTAWKRAAVIAAAALGISQSALAAWDTSGDGRLVGTVYYAGTESSEKTTYSVYTTSGSKESDPVELVAPPNQISFSACKDMATAINGILHLRQYVNSAWENNVAGISIKVGDLAKNSYKSFGPYSVNNQSTQFKFYTETGSYTRKVNSVKVTQATYVSVVAGATINFGTLTAGTSSAAQSYTVKYSNGTYGKPLNMTTSNGVFVLGTTSMPAGHWAQENFSVTFAPTTSGKFSGTISLNNGASASVALSGVAIPATAVASEATGINSTYFTANWASAAGATSYEVQLTDAAGNVLRTETTTATSLQFAGLTHSTGYQYRVLAHGNDDTQAAGWSNAVSVTTATPVLTADTENVTFSVIFPATEEQKIILSAAYLYEPIAATLTGNAFGYANLTEKGVTVTFNPTTPGVYSETLTLTSGGVSPDVVVTLNATSTPQTPEATAATDVEAESFVAHWNAVDGAETYNVYVNGALYAQVSDVQVKVENLLAKREYTYQVEAAAGGATSGKSNTITVKTISAVSFDLSETAVELSGVTGETVSEDVEITAQKLDDKALYPAVSLPGAGFSVEQGEAVYTEDGAYYSLAMPLTVNAKSTISGLKTAQLNVTLDGNTKTIPVSVLWRPQTPTATEATEVGGLKFTANWDETLGATGYELYVDGALYATTDGTSALVQGLTPATTYTYTVVALGNDDTRSEASNAIEVTTANNPALSFTGTAEVFDTFVGSETEQAFSIDAANLLGEIVAGIEGEGFAIVSEEYTENGGTINVKFAPQTTGEFEGVLTIKSELVEDLVIALNGVSRTGAVNDLAVGEVSHKAAVASWTAGVGNVSYLLTFGKTGETGVEIATDETNYQFEDLEASTEYTLTVVALSAEGVKSEAETTAFVTLGQPTLNAVSDYDFGKVVKGGNAQTTIAIEGRDLIAPIAYALEDSENFTLTEGENTIDIALNTAVVGEYITTVSLTSEDAETVTFEVKGVVIPQTPTIKTASNVKATVATLNWLAESGDVNYEITFDGATYTTSGTSLELTDLAPETTYEYTIVVIENGLRSETSAAATLTTYAKPTLTLKTSGSGLTTGEAWWSIASDYEVTPTALTIALNGAATTLGTDVKSYAFENLTKNTQYTVTLTAVVDGESLAQTSVFKTAASRGEYGEQLPNYTFEEWREVSANSKTGNEPVGWHSFVTAHKDCTLCGAAIVNTQLGYSDDARTGSAGNLSARISARTPMGSIIANGNMTTGQINAGSTSATDYTKNYNFSDPSNAGFNVPFTSKPDSIAVWVKFDQGSLKDNAYPDGGFSVWIHDNTRFQDPTTTEEHLVGKAISKFSTVSGTVITQENKGSFNYTSQVQKIDNNAWVRISVPFTYTGNAVEPAYIFATFKTNNEGSQGNKSDVLYVDDALLVYKPTLTVEALGKTEFEVGEDIALTYNITGTMSPYNLNAAANQVILEITDEPTFKNVKTLRTITTDEGGTIKGSLAGLGVGTYYVRVRTTNYPMKSQIQIIEVKEVEVETLETPEVYEPSVKGNTVHLEWNHVEKATGYVIVVKRTTESSGVMIAATALSVKENEETRLDVGYVDNYDLTLEEGGSYLIAIEAYNSAMSSERSTAKYVFLNESSAVESVSGERFELVIYPTIAEDVVNIENAERIETGAVYDINGRRVKNYNATEGKLYVGDLAGGVYVVRVQDDEARWHTAKFIKR